MLRCHVLFPRPVIAGTEWRRVIYCSLPSLLFDRHLRQHIHILCDTVHHYLIDCDGELLFDLLSSPISLHVSFSRCTVPELELKKISSKIRIGSISFSHENTAASSRSILVVLLFDCRRQNLHNYNWSKFAHTSFNLKIVNEIRHLTYLTISVLYSYYYFFSSLEWREQIHYFQ